MPTKQTVADHFFKDFSTSFKLLHTVKAHFIYRKRFDLTVLRNHQQKIKFSFAEIISQFFPVFVESLHLNIKVMFK